MIRAWCMAHGPMPIISRFIGIRPATSPAVRSGGGLVSSRVPRSGEASTGGAATLTSIPFATTSSTGPTSRTTPGTTILRIAVQYPIATPMWPSASAIRARRGHVRPFEATRMPAGRISPSRAARPRPPKGRQEEGKQAVRRLPTKKQVARRPPKGKQAGRRLPKGKQADQRGKVERQNRPPERGRAARKQRAARDQAQSKLRVPSSLVVPNKVQRLDRAREADRVQHGLAQARLDRHREWAVEVGEARA